MLATLRPHGRLALLLPVQRPALELVSSASGPPPRGLGRVRRNSAAVSTSGAVASRGFPQPVGAPSLSRHARSSPRAASAARPRPRGKVAYSDRRRRSGPPRPAPSPIQYRRAADHTATCTPDRNPLRRSTRAMLQLEDPHFEAPSHARARQGLGIGDHRLDDTYEPCPTNHTGTASRRPISCRSRPRRRSKDRRWPANGRGHRARRRRFARNSGTSRSLCLQDSPALVPKRKSGTSPAGSRNGTIREAPGRSDQSSAATSAVLLTNELSGLPSPDQGPHVP